MSFEIILELIYTWPDGRQEVRYRRPEGHPDLLDWREVILRPNSPYSIRAADPSIEQIRKSRFQSVRDHIGSDRFEFYLEGWKASEIDFFIIEEACPYWKDTDNLKRENWLAGWNDARCEP